jgi:pSer/pThr/pTyr-binding forkhead associated (FHA) protein
MGSPIVQLCLKGHVLQTFSLQGDPLRIGRLKENDIVIANASVSRFHAVLKRDNGKVILQDSGSQNGCYVNGTRILNSIVLEPGDEVLIGKHQLVLSEAGAEEEPSSELVKQEKNDAWDASKTYFVGAETQAKMFEGVGCEPAAAAEPDGEGEPSPASESAACTTDKPPQEIQASADDAVIESAAEPVGDVEKTPVEVAEPEPIEDAEPESIWAAEPEPIEDAEPEPTEDAEPEPIEDAEPEPIWAAKPEPIEDVEKEPIEVAKPEPIEDTEREPIELSEPEPIWHAGLVIQKEGKLDRILSWDQDRLVAGRSRGCEIFLDQPQISRRHAMFLREDGRYEVHDLDSVNGVLVNGEKSKERGLELGDVVKIEDFELTFLLDQQPITSEIKTAALSAAVSGEAESGFDMTMIGEDLTVGVTVNDPAAAEEPPAPVEEVDVEVPAAGLFGLDEIEEKNAVEVEPISPAPSQTEDPGVAVSTGEVLTFELRVRVEDLPSPLREALADLDQGELRLPVELVLKADA